MLTKVNDKVGGAKDPASTGNSRRVEGQHGPSADAAGDTVELTGDARLLQRLEKTLASLPDIDAGRVAAVKSSIASGDYVIDAEKIAEALLRTDRELGS